MIDHIDQRENLEKRNRGIEEEGVEKVVIDKIMKKEEKIQRGTVRIEEEMKKERTLTKENIVLEEEMIIKLPKLNMSRRTLNKINKLPNDF